MIPNRMDRINALIRQQLDEILLTEFEIPPGTLVSITSLETSKDLSYCTIGVSIAPPESADRVLKQLAGSAKKFHHILNDRIVIRKIPKLRFWFDPSQQKAAHIETLLDHLVDKGNSGNHQQPAPPARGVDSSTTTRKTRGRSESTLRS